MNKFFPLAALALLSCAREETQRDRYQREAKSEVEKFTTNLIGYSRTVESHFWANGDQVSNWTAKTIVDYVNKVGGIERTNIQFHFCIESNQLFSSADKSYVTIDYRPWALEDAEREHAAFIDRLAK